ncbi:P-loop NTPase fold protein [Pseudoalteromonas sp. GB43]
MAKDDPKHDYSFNVLQEQVATEDLFEDKTHQRVANTLNNLIANTDQGLTIGLEGGWGSGKSTVINLLKHGLTSSEEKTLFFAFDAWAHDGDPLRKIFLESLISSIDPQERDEKLNQLRNEVSARKKTVVVKTEKSASKLGKLLSLSALPIPVGAALLTAVKYEKLLWSWQSGASSVDFTFLFGILFSFFPLIALLVWANWGDKDTKTGNVKWDVLESESEENYTQDITEDGERTSIEFERFFNEILSYVFDSKSEYAYEQAIIVIDNLDRVEPEYAQNIWSTLQTFFQHRTSSLNNLNHQWKNKLWFLIPFDREGIKNIWQGNSALNGVSNDNSQVAASFMEKCFQITVEVPPPVMSAWIDYFKNCVEHSFTGWPEKQKIEYIESYTQCMSKLDISPTPRQIHTHINRAGVIALHWSGTFSAEAICIYSLSRQLMTESKFRVALLDDGIPNSFPNIQAVNKLKAELAGILFGVEAKKGMQLLLTPEIKSALSDGDGDKLKELESKHDAAFWLAFRACSNDWMVTDSHIDEYKLNTITAIYEAFSDSKNKVISFVRKIQAAFLSSFDNWKLDEFSYEAGLRALYNMTDKNEELLSELGKKTKKRIYRIVNSIDKDEFESSELCQLAELETFLKDSKAPIPRKHYIKLDIDSWQNWLEHCKKEHARFSSVAPQKSVFEQLIINSHFNQNALNKAYITTLEETFSMFPDNKLWIKLTPSIISWFNLNGREINAEVLFKLAIKVLASGSPDEKKAIKACVSQAPFWKRSAHADISTNPSLPFLVAISDRDFRDNQYVGTNVKSFFDKEFDKEMIAYAFDQFKAADELTSIWELAIDDRNEFAREIIRKIDNDDIFSIGASRVDEISWASDEETSTMVKQLCKSGAVKNIQSHVKTKPQIYSRTIYLLKEFGDEQAKVFVETLLEKLNREQWFEAINKHNELLKCIPENNPYFGKA